MNSENLLGTLNELHHGFRRETACASVKIDVRSDDVNDSNVFCSVLGPPFKQEMHVCSFFVVIDHCIEVFPIWVQVVQLAHKLPVEFHVY